MERTIELAGLAVKLIFGDDGFCDFANLPEVADTAEPAMEIEVATGADVRAGCGLAVKCGPDGVVEFSMHGADCRLDPRGGRGQLLLAPDYSVLEYVLKLVYSTLLLERGGGIFHAAGLVWEGRGYMFAGRHGAGKSTIAAAAPGGALILGDENVAVKRDGDGYRIYSMPRWALGGKGGAVTAAEPASAPLAACFVISHGSATEFGRGGAGELAHLLFDNLIYLLPEKAILESAMEFTEALQRGAPTAALRLALNDMEDLKNVVTGFLGKEV
ncbi:MAG: hypothetical protein WCX65_06985 [bacterium]